MHTIGKSASPGPSSEPDDRILECHGRMRGALDIAGRLASTDVAPDAEVVEATAMVRRYFSLALPLHEADEERSVAPRLLASAARGEVEDALDTMTRDHEAARGLLGELEALWSSIAVHPSARVERRRELLDLTTALDRHLRDHLAMEEAKIVPLLRRALRLEERRAIVDEMRARRGG